MVKPIRATKQIELHDRAVRTFVRQLLFTDPRSGQSGDVPIPVVHATPERAFATMDKLMKQLTSETQIRDKFAKYPFASFHRTNILELDPMRHNSGWMGSSLGYEGNPFKATLVLGTGDGSTILFQSVSATPLKIPVTVSTVDVRTTAVGDDPSKPAGCPFEPVVVASDNGSGVIADPSPGGDISGTVDYATGVVSVTFTTAPASGVVIDIHYNHTAQEIGFLGKWPFPYNFRYLVDFWIRHDESISEIAENFAVGPIGNAFNPYEAFLDVDYGTPWGVKIVPITDWRWIDNSDLVDGVAEHDRLKRITLEFIMKGWLYINPPNGLGPRIYTIHTIRTEFFLQDPGEGYDPLTGCVDLVDHTQFSTSDADEILIVDENTIVT